MEETTGIVKWFDKIKGYGFIQAGEADYFVHHSDICTVAEMLDEGEKVRFEAVKTDRGMKAVKVHTLKED